MKKIVAITLALIILFSTIVPVYAGIIRFTDSDRQQFYVDEYYEIIWDNFNNLFEFTPWEFIIQGGDIFIYQRSVQNFNNLSWWEEWLISFSKWITDETPTVERYIEILVNFMMLMQHDLDQVHNHMAEADTLKTFSDYLADVAGIGMSMVKTINPARFGVFERKVSNVVRYGGLAYSAVNLAKECIYSYRLLSKKLLDFENQFYFLTAIIRYADNDNLVEAARVLRNNVERAMEYRLNFVVENFDRVAEYIGRDIFIDIFVMELITNPIYLEQLGLSVIDGVALMKLAAGYKALSKAIVYYYAVRGFAVFAADMTVGLSNVLNRVVEMRAMYDINQALIRNTENLRRNVRSINNKDTIERIVNNMRSILYVNARGDYLLYQVSMYDGQLLSLFFTDRNAVRRWYENAKSIFMSLIFRIELFFPDIEWFRRDEEELEELPTELSSDGGDNQADTVLSDEADIRTNLDPYDLYREVLASYRELVENNFFPDMNWNEWWEWIGASSVNDAISRSSDIQIYYAFLDIDGNGIPELLIGTRFSDSGISEFDVLTWHDGQVHSLLPYYFYLQRQWGFVIHNNGVIEIHGWGIAADRFWRSFNEISSDGRTPSLIEIDYVVVDGQPPIFFHQGEVISESEFGNIMMQYTSRMSLEPFESSIAIEWRSFYHNKNEDIITEEELPTEFNMYGVVNIADLWNKRYINEVILLIGEPIDIRTTLVESWHFEDFFIEFTTYYFNYGLNITAYTDGSIERIFINYDHVENRQHFHLYGIDGMSTRENVVGKFGLPLISDYYGNYHYSENITTFSFGFDSNLVVRSILKYF